MNEERHVLAPFNLDPKDAFERDGINVTVGLEARGINEASAYPLFCAAHDGTYFTAFDRIEAPLDLQAAGRAAFRAAALEAHKKAAKKYSPVGIAQMLAPEVDLDAGTHMRISAWAVGAANADDFMKKFSDCVERDDWTGLSHLVVECNGPTSLVACGAVSSEVTPDGVVNFHSGDFMERGGYVFLNSRTDGKTTQFVFSYFHGDHHAKRLVKWLSKQTPKELLRVLPYLLADLTEDLFIRPIWFWSLSERNRERLGQRLQVFRVLGFDNEQHIATWTSINRFKITAVGGNVEPAPPKA